MKANSELISYEKAKALLSSYLKSFGTETIEVNSALNRVLAEPLYASMDLPPFNRVTMDGFALNYDVPKTEYEIEAIQYAGQEPLTLKNKGCIEIMTGAVLPEGCNTVVPYEDVIVENDKIILQTPLKIGQNIHKKGSDKKIGDLLFEKHQIINPGFIALAISMSKTKFLVEKNPKICIISTGDELVEVGQVRLDHQIIRSNDTLIEKMLILRNIPSEKLYLEDNFVKKDLQPLIEKYDMLIFSGGVSKGKKDRVEEVLTELGAEAIFHGLKQKPGKPMYFAKLNNCMIFGLPGNPVSTFVNFNVYVLPFINECLGLTLRTNQVFLGDDIVFKPQLSYFMLAEIENKAGKLIAKQVLTNGSGDFSNLAQANAIVILPEKESEVYKKDEIFTFYSV